MTTKECFRRIAQAESSISAKKQRVSALKDLAASSGSPNFSGMPKNPSKSLSPMADAVIVSPQLIERYAMCSARWIQCEEMNNTLGLLGKHPTTGKL